MIGTHKIIWTWLSVSSVLAVSHCCSMTLWLVKIWACWGRCVRAHSHSPACGCFTKLSFDLKSKRASCVLSYTSNKTGGKRTDNQFRQHHNQFWSIPKSWGRKIASTHPSSQWNRWSQYLTMCITLTWQLNLQFHPGHLQCCNHPKTNRGTYLNSAWCQQSF